jgi:hypothetical protein
MRRHSTAMMATGITMLSLSPVAAVISLVAAAQKAGCSIIDSATVNGVAYDNKCDDYDATIYGFAIGSVALIGAGIPLTIVGAKNEPVPPGEAASLSPWVTAQGAGTTLRLRW